MGEADRWKVEPAQRFEVRPETGRAAIEIIGVIPDDLCGVV